MKKNIPLLLVGISILGLMLRLWNSNWDWGFHLHPDERAILLFSIPLQFPLTVPEFFSPESSWNPHFFAYGSFPLYLLKILGSLGNYFHTSLATYEGIYIIGRIISAFFDTGTIIVLYFLSKKIFSRNVAILSSFFYAISVLPIQLSHFYAVDTLLTFYIIFLLYQLLRFYENPTKWKALGIGILFGFALATKTSAFVLIASIVITISLDFFLVFLKQPHKPHVWFPHIPLFLRRLFTEGFLVITGTIGTFFLLEPYAFIDSSTFITQTLQQSEMTKSAFTFPYTLQYVGKIPYVYDVQNIIFWGMGPLLGIFATIGTFYTFLFFFQNKLPHMQKQTIILSFFTIYFLTVGSFAIGFMRYMLPLYPFFCLFAAYFMYQIYGYLQDKNPTLTRVLASLCILLLFIWPLSFMQIYHSAPTRVLATQWILQNIPPGKTIAIEHWDDSLPLWGQEQYHIETLELYQPDSQNKWSTINQQLEKADYIILASNRLYTPLQKLTNCEKLPIRYCYKTTALYYQDLFAGKRGFKKVIDFSAYPKIPFTDVSFDDSNADESFTVYDHPKVIIFQKN